MSKFAELWRYVESVKPEIERSLKENLPFAPPFIETRFNEALEYIVLSDGKRLRPVLTLLGAEVVGGKREKVLPTSVAVEFVHTSSLIFDDLPCMDNAQMRRGQLSLHEKFGEDLAILVALSLLNHSYGLVFVNLNGNTEQAIRAHAELVRCIGSCGMVGGQSVDLALAKGAQATDTEEFETIRNLKTSALMRMALRVGAILSGANDKHLATLTKFADLLGDAYQTSDDLLDLQEDNANVQEKMRLENFALERGILAAQNRITNLIAEAKQLLKNEFGDTKPVNLLCLMADYIGERKA
jgi:geranylgeranyl diphosphate synthase type II